MIKKIVFTLIPKVQWIVLILGVSVSFLPGNWYRFSHIFFVLFLFHLFVKVNIVLHEFGHFFVAKWAGYNVRRLVLGIGHETVRFNFLNAPVILNSKLDRGAVHFIVSNRNWLKIKLALLYSSGFIVNLLFAILIYSIFGFDSGKKALMQFPFIICFSSVFVAISTIVPYKLIIHGVPSPSDGLQLLLIPSRAEEIAKGAERTAELYDAFEAMERKEYKDALAIYEKYSEHSADGELLKLNIAICYLKIGENKKAIQVLEGLEQMRFEHGKKAQKAIVFNALAWCHVVDDSISEADRLSKLAYDLDPNHEQVRSTRGSVLIELGNYAGGIEILKDEANFKYVNNHTLCASMYLCYAYQQIGELEKSMKHRTFVETNEIKLEMDEIQILNRLRSKLEKDDRQIPNIPSEK